MCMLRCCLKLPECSSLFGSVLRGGMGRNKALSTTIWRQIPPMSSSAPRQPYCTSSHRMMGGNTNTPSGTPEEAMAMAIGVYLSKLAVIAATEGTNANPKPPPVEIYFIPNRWQTEIHERNHVHLNSHHCIREFPVTLGTKVFSKHNCHIVWVSYLQNRRFLKS